MLFSLFFKHPLNMESKFTQLCTEHIKNLENCSSRIFNQRLKSTKATKIKTKQQNNGVVVAEFSTCKSLNQQQKMKIKLPPEPKKEPTKETYSVEQKVYENTKQKQKINN